MDDTQGSWTVDFYDFRRQLTCPAADEGLRAYGDIHNWARRNGARQGTPFLLAPDGTADARINLFFRVGSVASRRPRTWRRYAFSLAVWLDFLEVYGRRWDEAAAEDFDAFKHWRMTDHRNIGRVRPTSFDTDRAGLNTFYTWASQRYGVVNPVPTKSAEPAPQQWSGQGPRRDPARPAGSPRRQVKWLLRTAFEQWRDVGLRGYGFDGDRSDGWRGFNEDRDAAFVDGLYGTGLRLSEWASVLDVELPMQDVAGRFPKAWLAEACIKGGRAGREYRVPRSVLKSLAGYLDPLEGSRTEAIDRARRRGRYDQMPGLTLVTGYSRKGRSLYLLTETGRTAVSLDVIGPEERLRLFRRAEDGLEPLALWLGNDGMPKQAHGWEKTFQRANERIRKQWAAAHGTDGQECPLWARPHMARHSFALKWFTILSAVWNQQMEGFTDTERRDLREQFGDVWFQLATLLGHSSPEVTKDWYLEPFTGLQLDYILSLLDEEEQAAVDALLRKVAADSGRVLQVAHSSAFAADGGDER
ncbi:integrase [Streptomyces sp. NPDC006012]|uniref:integrase n=1 Tax=Streptomyces sp. NPDC006012 TaxID=3364739 RepID=UPI0036BF183C